MCLKFLKKLIIPFFVVLLVSFFPTSVAGAPTLQQLKQQAWDDDVNPNAVFPDNNSPDSEKTITQKPASKSTLAVGERPNIIVIVTDDQPPSSLSIAGNPVLKTPNIDSLANQGFYFKNMYLPLAWCAPSRASILTGKMPHSHGLTFNRLMLPLDQLTLPEVLADNNYDTAIIGKCHLGDPNNPDKYHYGFNYRIIPYPDFGAWGDWYNFTVSRNGVVETHLDTYITDWFTSEAISYIKDKRDKNKPFFLWLPYFAPHDPVTPPKGQNRYPLDTIPTPVSLSDDLTTKPPQQSLFDTHLWYEKLGWTGVKLKKKDMFEVMSNVDDNVGRVIKAISEAGLRDNTIIIFMSDNGTMYGEHQVLYKGNYMYEEQVKTPFLFSFPKLFKNKNIITALTTSLDIFPTVLDILKIPIPSELQGKSLLPLMNNVVTSIHDSIFIEYYKQNKDTVDEWPIRAVVSNGFKFVHYPASIINGIQQQGNNFELYDLTNDPLEMTNILRNQNSTDNAVERVRTDSKYSTTLDNLVRQMAKWQTDTKDPRRLLIVNPKIVQDASGIRLTWQTQTDATSEVQFRLVGCQTCGWQEYRDLKYIKDHAVLISSLESNKLYDIEIYSIGPGSNGGNFSTQSTPSDALLGDLNNDKKVNNSDYLLFLADFGKTGSPGFVFADINKDGKVDIFDYNKLVGAYQK